MMIAGVGAEETNRNLKERKSLMKRKQLKI
jgi:hypothetical protein